MTKLKFTVGNQSGQGLTEYIALVLLIAVVSIGVTQTLGKTIKSKITEASNHISKISGNDEGGSKSRGGGLGGLMNVAKSVFGGE
jgi:Flp pilus assembly pilin Flp